MKNLNLIHKEGTALSSTYSIAIIGLEAGIAKDTAIKKLAELLEMTDEMVASILESQKFIVKSGVDLATSAKYEATLRECGCIIVVEPIVVSNDFNFDLPVFLNSTQAISTTQPSIEQAVPADRQPEKSESFLSVLENAPKNLESWRLLSSKNKFQYASTVIVALWLGFIGIGFAKNLVTGKFVGGLPIYEMTDTERTELQQIKNSPYLTGTLGHEISEDTQLWVIPDNFGKKLGCQISVRARDPRIGLEHPNWSMTLQLGFNKQMDDFLIVRNALSDDAGKVLFMVGRNEYSIDEIRANGVRVKGLTADIIDDLMASGTAKALSGMIEGGEISSKYDLTSFKKAYKFARDICSS